MAAPTSRAGPGLNTALKDLQLAYRACTLGYARSLQLQSPRQLVGLTDGDFLSAASSALVREAELRLLQSGIPEVTDGDSLVDSHGNVLHGWFFLRSPVLNTEQEITGVEIKAVAPQTFAQSYQEILSRNFQYRSLLNTMPVGVLVYRNDEYLYHNGLWKTLVSGDLGSDSSEALLRLLNTVTQGGADSAALPAIELNGRSLSFGNREIRWNATPATLVFCIERRLMSLGQHTETSEQNFIEKRKGVRRDVSLLPSADETQVDHTQAEAAIFNAMKHPVFVCSNWIPVHANSAADFFLKNIAQQKSLQTGNSRYHSIESWFTGAEKADIETMIRQRDLIDAPVSVSVLLESQRYLVSMSPTVWEGRSAILVSMQIETARQRELSELKGQLRKLEDYASSAGDFFWEMDNEQRLSRISLDLSPLFGINNTAILGVPLEQLIEQFVQPEDMAEWSGLKVDLSNGIPFRDREYKWQAPDGSRRVVRISGVPVFDDNNNFAGYRGIGSDYTKAYTEASSVAYHASHDSLTGLVNRREFESRCDEAIALAKAAEHTHALCFMDLDNFKVVNDTCGHLAGDELLRQLSDLFSGLVRKSDVLARLGGDEFGVLIFDVGLNEALRLANQLRAEVESFQFLWDDNRFTVGASIGIVIIDDRWDSRSSLFGAADSACYEAKNLGRNRVAVYKDTGIDPELIASTNHWVESINSAIDEKRIRLSMQKILSLDSWDRSVSSVELLMRMVSPSGEIISPGAFLPAAERYGLSVSLDRVVVELAIDWLQGQPHVTESMQLCAINLHGSSIADEEFTQFLLDALKAANFDISILCFEITETAVIANLSGAALFMKRVADLGCQFALDDFGSGLSSFAYLKNLPVKYLKIDGMFVKGILEDTIDFAMVKAINEIGQTLGKKTIAEFVENDDVLEKLRDMGVDLAQGYHIGRPEIIDI